MEPSKQLLGDPFFDLLEAAAEEAHQSVRLLARLSQPMDEESRALAVARQRSERIASEIDTRLAKTIMASLRKEDIEALSRALGRIPASVERFNERLGLAGDPRPDLGLTRWGPVMVQGTEALVGMVGQLRWFENTQQTKVLSARVEQADGEAEQILAQGAADFYRGERDPLRVLIAKDLFEHLQAIADRCREAAETVKRIVLKYA